jgi:D-alanine-D-alanine ligase
VKKLRVGIIYGGRSGEHEVSLASAAAVFQNLDPERYLPVAILIEKDGRWALPARPPAIAIAADVIQGAKKELSEPTREAHLVAHPGGDTLLTVDRRENGAVVAGLGLDVVFPVLHGPYGEDGTVQGLLELANVPYVGAGVLASAVGMDKAAMKMIFVANSLPICDYHVFLSRDWRRDERGVMQTIVSKLGFPVFVKPANLGSSVGISKARHAAELRQAVNWPRSSIAKSSSKRPCRTRVRSNAPCWATTTLKRRCPEKSCRRASSTTTKPSTSTRVRSC